MSQRTHYIPASALGEKCRCGKDAKHKIEEVLPGVAFCEDHPFTLYLCCECFYKLMGKEARKSCCNARTLVGG